jgi:molecular chaperone GrpE
MSNQSKKPHQKKWVGVAEESTKEESHEQEATHPESKEKLSLEHPSYPELEEKLTFAEQEAEKHRQDCLRALAEIQNVHRRSKLDLENAHKFSIEKFVRELLPVLDSLERSLEGKETVSANAQSIISGIELTVKMFISTLAKFGVEQINPVGQPFNPAFHEAMSAIQTPDVEPNHVVKVLQKGYQLQGRLLRPAMVIVAKA